MLRTTLGEAAAYYAEHAPRGEFVLIVEGAAPLAPEAVSEADALEAVRALIGQGLSRKDAVRRVSEQTGIPKNELYNAAVRE